MRMRLLQLIALTSLPVLVAMPRGVAAQSAKMASGHEKMAAHAPKGDYKWGPAPAVFPAGAQLAVLAGDPGKAGEYTVRLRMPSGYRIAPHTHPTDENVTVIQGTFEVGLGERFNASAVKPLTSGGFIVAPANMAHYAQSRGQTIVQVHGIGPFTLTYVNSADDPRTRASR